MTKPSFTLLILSPKVLLIKYELKLFLFRSLIIKVRNDIYKIHNVIHTKGLAMTHSKYNRTLTLQLYLLAGVLFATYGGRVCPMLETLSMREIGTHVAATFIPLFLVRHFGFCDHNWLKTHDTAKLDTTLFFIASIPLALFYNLNYDFPLDSNLKVLLGMAMFGFFTGSILQIVAKLDDFESLIGKANNTELVGVRRSIVKQMIVLMTLLMFTLTFLLLLVALKDVFWLQHNPEKSVKRFR